ncbi:MAG: hypothetical protein KatS3mg044_1497 [Rhodothermaceae bacterium]|nr:MAG: hypothetical protein KatS3mg044_1497 [Rhodothermaceae bacterium]
MRFVLLSFLLLVLAPGCHRPPDVPAESTRRMAQRLDAIAARTEADPRRNVHANRARVRQLRAMPVPADPMQRARYLFELGRELLRAGDNEAAVDTLEAVRAVLDNLGDGVPPAIRLGVLDELAIAYLRLGEAENCLDGHNPDRCLFPLPPGGVHTRTRGSLHAIALYKELLEAHPDNLNARWLLNVAYMTLGLYPEQVPPRWRIPPDALAPEYELPRFPDIAPDLGVDVLGLSGGAVMEDFNGDGWLDLMASSWGLRDPLRYFERQPDGTFADRTREAGLEGLTGGLNLVHADYDNDGHPDVLVLRGAWLPEGHPNSLLRNRGDGTFEDVTEAAGLLTLHPTQTAAWGDYDNDGDLDLFIGNESNRQAGVHPCELFRNNGDGTFTDVAPALGLDVRGYIKAVLWGDVDQDGDLDLFLSDWENPNLLFRNDGPGPDGTWRFTEMGEAAGVREPVESFPAWFWDYDNDGDLDLFVSGWRASSGDMAAEYLGLPVRAEMPRLYRNRGDGTFEDVTGAARLRRVLYTMGSNFGDLDNDGWLDFYAGTGDPDFRSIMPNRAFRNAGGRFFQDVTAATGMGHLQKGHGVAFGDLDGDGDQDLYTVLGGAFEGDVYHNALFLNPGNANHWLTVRLEGVTSNRSALGTRLRVDVSGPDGPRSIHRTVTTGGSFGSSSLQQEIGLGSATRIDRLTITWPTSGIVQVFESVPLDAVLRIREDRSTYDVVTRPVHPLRGRDATPPDHGH